MFWYDMIYFNSLGPSTFYKIGYITLYFILSIDMHAYTYFFYFVLLYIKNLWYVYCTMHDLEKSKSDT